MTKQELQNRFSKLIDTLELSHDLGYFSAGQRTCIHQELAAILQALDRINYSGIEASSPTYQIPKHLEQKIQRVLNDFKKNP